MTMISRNLTPIYRKERASLCCLSGSVGRVTEEPSAVHMEEKIRCLRERLAADFGQPSSSPLRMISKLLGKEQPGRRTAGRTQRPRSCWICRRQLGSIRRRAVTCSVCCAELCWSCCSLDLLAFPDEPSDRLPKLVINGIRGAPDAPPAEMKQLAVCNVCKQYMTRCQYDEVVADERARNASPVDRVVLDLFNSLNDKKNLITDRMKSYSQLVEAMGIGANSPSALPAQLDMRVLAKSQIDLVESQADMSSLILTYARRQRPQLPQLHNRLYDSIIQASRAFYTQSRNRFEQLHRQLEQHTPTDIFETLQSHYNFAAINAVYLLLRQFGLELLSIKQSVFAQAIAPEVAKCDEVVSADMKQSCRELNKDWDDHLLASKAFLKERIKTSPLLLRYLRADSANQMTDLELSIRFDDALYRVKEQFKARASESRFARSKASLQSLHEQVASKMVQFST